MTAGQLYFIIFLIFASDVATWEVHTWRDGDRESSQLQEAITAKQAAEVKSAKIAKDYEAKSAALEAKYQSLAKEWSNVRIKKSVSDCNLPAESIGVLKGNNQPAGSAPK